MSKISNVHITVISLCYLCLFIVLTYRQKLACSTINNRKISQKIFSVKSSLVTLIANSANCREITFFSQCGFQLLSSARCVSAFKVDESSLSWQLLTVTLFCSCITLRGKHSACVYLKLEDSLARASQSFRNRSCRERIRDQAVQVVEKTTGLFDSLSSAGSRYKRNWEIAAG